MQGMQLIEKSKFPKAKIETLAVHAGRRSDPATGAVTPPIHLSTTFDAAPTENTPWDSATRGREIRRGDRSKNAWPRSKVERKPWLSRPGWPWQRRCYRGWNQVTISSHQTMSTTASGK